MNEAIERILSNALIGRLDQGTDARALVRDLHELIGEIRGEQPRDYVELEGRRVNIADLGFRRTCVRLLDRLIATADYARASAVLDEMQRIDRIGTTTSEGDAP